MSSPLTLSPAPQIPSPAPPMTDGFSTPSQLPRVAKRVLLVFDGGDAPGYATVAVALTEEGSRRGYEMWAATEGLRSLTSDRTSQPAYERLIVGRGERYALLAQGIPARSMGRRVLDAGSDFRSERYRGFRDRSRRVEAAEDFARQGFTHLICIGGDGTFAATKAWREELGLQVPVGFINVSIDNDLTGDRAIGFATGVEAGAGVARGLLEDAYTHKRIYLLEMMGNRSGRHALHCGVAARAHLVVLPGFQFPDAVIAELAAALAKVDYALVVVAEGYELEKRKRLATTPSASEFLRGQLERGGLRDGPQKRVIAEPFSRHLRGVRPAYAEVSAAYLKASLLMDAFDAGRSGIMPYVLAAHDAGLRDFADVRSHHGVEPAFMPLLERLGLPLFRRHVSEHFVVGGHG